MFRLVWQCMFAPRLFKIYHDGPKDAMYQPKGLERWCDKVISTASTMVYIGMYIAPFIGVYTCRRGFFSTDETRFMIRCLGCAGCMLAVCCILRGIGRACNSKYVAFLRSLNPNDIEGQRAFLEGVRRYDFDFSAWPITYAVATRPTPRFFTTNPFSKCANPDLPRIQRVTIQILAYLATHTFGLRLVYPGAVSLIHHLLSAALFQGRTQLVETYEGQRTKIQTSDRNTIDTMFIDNRENSPRGKILVICCEGNSGFYEIGIMTTPAKGGYSVLGWNHPGFAGSSGRPYPDEEHNAIEAVMKFAFEELGFRPDEIVMYGWSIGGYAAAWAAVNFQVGGVVLDATFDDLLALAENQMPSSWSRLVKEVIRSYVDLNVGELLVKYPGPVQLVRRTDDEIICLRPGLMSTNCGNELLVRLIEHRHPSMHEQTRASVRRLVPLLDSQRSNLSHTSINEYEQRALRLIGIYMHEFKSSHCAPLPEQHFECVMETIAKMARNNQ